jgi:hypothetical protein
MSTHRYCDGWSRRDFLKLGALGALGVHWSNYLGLAQAGELKAGAAQRGIFVNLGGGPSHLDTFDPKPDAPSELRGEFKPIDTCVPGVQISEMFPKLAACADKFAILRGVSHTLAAHELGSQYLNTGNRPLPSLQYPGFGAVVSKEISGQPELPSFVAIPNTPQHAGYLGTQYAALETNSMPQPGKPFAIRGVSLGKGTALVDIERRRQLLDDLDQEFRGFEQDRGLVEGLDEFSKQAYSIITSSRAREAFDVSQEPASVAERFGAHGFGLSCLLALRLVAAGVPFVTVNFGGWDMHGDLFNNFRKGKAAQLDGGLSALLTTLAERGLLESTAVCATGEFGRTPKINPRAGRDHWPRAMCVLLAGGGMRGGQVIGASDEKGMGPAADPITPEQVAASLYHSLGVDYAKEYRTNTGRPLMIVRDGAIVPQLFS